MRLTISLAIAIPLTLLVQYLHLWSIVGPFCLGISVVAVLTLFWESY